MKNAMKAICILAGIFAAVWGVFMIVSHDPYDKRPFHDVFVAAAKCAEAPKPVMKELKGSYLEPRLGALYFWKIEGKERYKIVLDKDLDCRHREVYSGPLLKEEDEFVYHYSYVAHEMGEDEVKSERYTIILRSKNSEEWTVFIVSGKTNLN